MLVLDILHKDRILEGLPLLEHQLLTPLCEDIALHLGDIIEEAGHSVQFLYFPIDSAISMTHVQDQEHMVEVMVTGKEGCTGASIVLGDDRSPSMAMIQIGGVAIRIATSDVITRLSRLPYLKACLTRYNLLTMNLAVLSVGCSQFHAPPQRVARWLIAHWYRTGIESFPFSCEFLAVQVGVHPTIVKETLVDFERQGVVKQGRNTVSITGREGLERKACRCYAMARESTEEYLRSLADLAEAHRS